MVSLTSKSLRPLPYHQAVVSYLKKNEPELWQWASSAEVLNDHVQQMRTAMLKSSYRLDADAHPDLAIRCNRVMQNLEIKAPVTLYQAGGEQMNAMLCHFPGEAHIVFTGQILSALNGTELDALLAHELAHYLLWTLDLGDYLVADRLLMASANDPRASSSHAQTARKFRLYTEIFADRGALVGCGELEASVAALVKVETGVPEVSAASYLRQADEIFLNESIVTSGLDHPELFIRARALRLWSENDKDLDSWLAESIEGQLAIDQLDLVGQEQLSHLSRRFLNALLQPQWFRTELTMAHARLFFPDFVSVTASDDESLLADLNRTLHHQDAPLVDYICYLLLDFATVDPQLEDLPVVLALSWSIRLKISEKFEKIAIKELGLSKKQLNKLRKDASSLSENAELSK